MTQTYKHIIPSILLRSRLSLSNMLILRLTACIVLLCCTICAVAQDAPVTIKAKADSTALIMGDRTIVNVEILKNSHSGALLSLPEIGQDYYGMELADIAADSTDLGNGRIQLNYRLTFQAFDPAELLTLPPFVYAIDGDTIKSGILTFKVFPVDLSPELGDINDIESLTIHPDNPAIDPESRWYDFIPGWTIWIFIGIALIALVVTMMVLYKKNGPALIRHRKPIPPYELAVLSLNKIRTKNLIERGLAKQFYTEVTDVWRKYLHGRFGIPAMEMTSRQIMKQLRRNNDTHAHAQSMEQTLQLSDAVKFAALDPTRDEMIRTYDTIYAFVEATKPVPEPEDDPNAQKAADTDNQTPIKNPKPTTDN